MFILSCMYVNHLHLTAGQLKPLLTYLLTYLLNWQTTSTFLGCRCRTGKWQSARAISPKKIITFLWWCLGGKKQVLLYEKLVPCGCQHWFQFSKLNIPYYGHVTTIYRMLCDFWNLILLSVFYSFDSQLPWECHLLMPGIINWECH